MSNQVCVKVRRGDIDLEYTNLPSCSDEDLRDIEKGIEETRLRWADKIKKVQQYHNYKKELETKVYRVKYPVKSHTREYLRPWFSYRYEDASDSARSKRDLADLKIDTQAVVDLGVPEFCFAASHISPSKAGLVWEFWDDFKGFLSQRCKKLSLTEDFEISVSDEALAGATWKDLRAKFRKEFYEHIHSFRDNSASRLEDPPILPRTSATSHVLPKVSSGGDFIQDLGDTEGLTKKRKHDLIGQGSETAIPEADGMTGPELLDRFPKRLKTPKVSQPMNDPTGTLNESPEIERHLDTISTVYMAINTHNANPPKATNFGRPQAEGYLCKRCTNMAIQKLLSTPNISEQQLKIVNKVRTVCAGRTPNYEDDEHNRKQNFYYEVVWMILENPSPLLTRASQVMFSTYARCSLDTRKKLFATAIETLRNEKSTVSYEHLLNSIVLLVHSSVVSPIDKGYCWSKIVEFALRALLPLSAEVTDPLLLLVCHHTLATPFQPVQQECLQTEIAISLLERCKDCLRIRPIIGLCPELMLSMLKLLPGRSMEALDETYARLDEIQQVLPSVCASSLAHDVTLKTAEIYKVGQKIVYLCRNRNMSSHHPEVSKLAKDLYAKIIKCSSYESSAMFPYQCCIIFGVVCGVEERERISSILQPFTADPGNVPPGLLFLELVQKWRVARDEANRNEVQAGWWEEMIKAVVPKVEKTFLQKFNLM